MTRAQCVALFPALLALVIVPAAGAATAVEDAAKIVAESGFTGGLVVHVGCDEGVLTQALGSVEGAVAHGLDADAAAVARARERLSAEGVYGRVSVELWSAAHLPHAGNLAALVVVSEAQGIGMAEFLRVVRPGGVVCVREGEAWRVVSKPEDPRRDEWTHFLHGPDGNAVSSDRVVAPPARMQWTASPRWARSHEHQSTISAVVTAGGRLFSIVDRGPAASVLLPSSWTLVARDAYSGVELWTRDLGLWEGVLRPFRSGPAELPRRLVATEKSVFVTLGYGAPVTRLHAATGETEATYADSEGALEIVHTGGTLYLVTGDLDKEAAAEAAERRGAIPPPTGKRIAAIRAEDGQEVWSKADAATAEVMPLTLAVAANRVYFHNPRELVCLDASNGEVVWRTERPLSTRRPAWSTPTLVVYDGVVLCADRRVPQGEGDKRSAEDTVDWIVSYKGGGQQGELLAYDAATGVELWRAPCFEGYNAPVDVLVADGLVWTGRLISSRDPGITEGRDPRTGEVVRTRARDQNQFTVGMSHHRCHRNRATENYLILGRAGAEFIDVQSGEATAYHWVRGACQYGTLPANGLLYAPSHSCACYLNTKLNGFNALAPAPEESQASLGSSDRLTHGPAYAAVSTELQARSADALDWPTLRHDAERSGSTASAVTLPLRQTWTVRVGERLTPPVIAADTVLVADQEGYRLVCLDAGTGEAQWSIVSGGRLDSPPTVVGDLAVFGCRDGSVTCVTLDSGQLVWRFRAGAGDRRVMAYERLESAWPIHGSVLALPPLQGESGPSVAFAAGRSSYLDGGIYLYRLDAASGRVLAERTLSDRDPETGREPGDAVRGFGMEGVLPDVLSYSQGRIFMRHGAFDRQSLVDAETSAHLFSPTGFLDDSWWHRSYWLYGTEYISGWGGWWQAGNRVPAGRIMVFDERAIYGYGRSFMPSGNAGQWSAGEAYRVFATERDFETLDWEGARRGRRGPRTSVVKMRWSKAIWLESRAMVLAKDVLFSAGPEGSTRDSAAAFHGREGVLLKAVAAASGDSLAAYRLDAMPVFDGMAVARGALFLAMSDGTLRCYRGDRGQPLEKVQTQANEDVAAPAPAPPPYRGPLPPLPDTRAHPQFERAANCRIGAVNEAIRVAADKGTTAVVVKELPAPMSKATISVRLQAVPGYTTPDYWRNGFLAFGDSPEDKDLVKCGIKFIQKSAMIMEGATSGGSTRVSTPLTSDPNGEFTMTVQVDVQARTVTLEVDGKTLKATLQNPLPSIRYVGFTVLNGVTDFSGLTVEET